MENIRIKRSRSLNWDEEEKRLLTQLATEKVHLIENKDTSTNTNRLKKAAWREILSSFNSLNKHTRDLQQLLTQWRNMKGKAKLRESQYRRTRMMTGRGTPPESPPEDLVYIQALPAVFIGDTNNFDSDPLHLNKMKQSNDIPTESEENSTGSAEPEIKVPQKQQSNASSNSKGKFENYEEQLFALVIKSKEREDEMREEVHQRRMNILKLEEEYWEKKINSIEK